MCVGVRWEGACLCTACSKQACTALTSRQDITRHTPKREQLLQNVWNAFLVIAEATLAGAFSNQYLDLAATSQAAMAELAVTRDALFEVRGDAAIGVACRGRPNAALVAGHSAWCAVPAPMHPVRWKAASVQHGPVPAACPQARQDADTLAKDMAWMSAQSAEDAALRQAARAQLAQAQAQLAQEASAREHAVGQYCQAVEDRCAGCVANKGGKAARESGHGCVRKPGSRIHGTAV